MLLGELVVMLSDELPEGFPYPAFRHSFHLQQQAFLQIPGTYASGVKPLQGIEHFFYFVGLHVHVLVDGQLVADAFNAFPEQAIVVKRAYQVFHDGLLLLGQVQHAYLFF